MLKYTEKLEFLTKEGLYDGPIDNTIMCEWTPVEDAIVKYQTILKEEGFYDKKIDGYWQTYTDIGHIQRNRYKKYLEMEKNKKSLVSVQNKDNNDSKKHTKEEDDLKNKEKSNS